MGVTLSGYTFVRNGVELDYPFVESIQSVLPICDEFIVVLGDSHDSSQQAIEAIGSDKIRIVHTVWDMNLRKHGTVFALQSNIGLDHCTGDWILHLQADEVIHENDLDRIPGQIAAVDSDPGVEAFILPYYHFWGSYGYIRTTRRVHRYEVRVLRNKPGIRSYHDSQGFRIYDSMASYHPDAKGRKLRVHKMDVPVYHYKRVRPPELMKTKMIEFFRFYKDDAWLERYTRESDRYDYQAIDYLEEFTGEHPALMQPRVRAQNWTFTYDPKKRRMKFRYRVLLLIEKLTGYRLFEYRNYTLIR